MAATGEGPSQSPRELPTLSGVQIQLRGAPSGGAPGEWTMMELQGTVETGAHTLPGMEIGDFVVLPGDKAKLRIGRQLLDGAAVPLKKPQAVLVKTPAKDGHGTVYTVVGVIRRKVSFTTRPNPAKPPALPPPPPCERQEAENRAPLAAAAHGCDRDTQVTTQ
ncbi:hypothetical protein KFE25_004355 [Diacronema lutheri]|uniref:Uncharacterized protein n=1 Tax=Diacronema lutheri TaxID=2081491 RepID=A0A8J5XD79_DIALT|nr:hypothetical protein KFE25_004355 [Diacronema lutheri]